MKSGNPSRGARSLKELMGEVENFKSHGPIWEEQQREADNAASYRGFEVKQQREKRKKTEPKKAIFSLKAYCNNSITAEGEPSSSYNHTIQPCSHQPTSTQKLHILSPK